MFKGRVSTVSRLWIYDVGVRIWHAPIVEDVVAGFWNVYCLHVVVLLLRSPSCARVL